MNTTIGVWVIPLAITHLLPLVLIPLIMRVFSSQKAYYQPRINSNLLIQIGLVCLMISMILGFLTHVFITRWANKTDVFNPYDAVIFTIMTAAFCLISYGLKKGKADAVIMILAVVSVPVGYIYRIEPFRILGQTIGLTYMVIRGYQILRDKRIFLVPVFSVGTNVFFLILQYRTGHPVFHMLHDLAGTLLGFGIFGYLFAVNGRRRSRLPDAGERNRA
jgi:hypothetical protein